MYWGLGVQKNESKLLDYLGVDCVLSIIEKPDSDTIASCLDLMVRRELGCAEFLF